MTINRKTERRRASTRELHGFTAIMKDGVQTRDGELVFFLLKPTNVAVLSDASTTARVMALAEVLKGFPELEMLCLNSREDYEGNKRYLAARITEETVPEVQALLRQDLLWLDTVQSQMATAREFALVLRLKQDRERATESVHAPKPSPLQAVLGLFRPKVVEPENPALVHKKPAKRSTEAALTLARLEKTLKSCGFAVRLAGSQEIMRLLAVYFAQNVTTDHFEEYDGQRFGMEYENHGGTL